MISELKQKNWTEKMVFVYLACVVANLTVAIPQAMGLSLAMVGAVEILFLVYYHWMNRALIRKEYLKPLTGVIILLFLVWPLASSLWAPFLRMREPALVVLFFLQITAGIIFVRNFSWKAISQMAGAVLLVAGAMIFVSWQLPDAFSFLADRDFQGRAFGLYGQPNRSGNATTLLFFIWISGFTPRLYIWKPLAFIALAGSIIVTGSRGAFLIAVLCYGVYSLIDFRRGERFETIVVRRIASAFCLIVIGASTLLLAVASGLVSSERMVEDSAVGRSINRIAALVAEDDLLEFDKSLQGRTMAAEVFMEAILDKPLIGHGLFSARVDRFTGKVPIASHNTFLNSAYEYGASYLVCLIGLYLYCFTRLIRLPRSSNSRVMPVGITVAFLAFVLFHFHTNTLFDSRYSVVMFGIILGVIYNRRFLLQMESRSRFLGPNQLAGRRARGAGPARRPRSPDFP